MRLPSNVIINEIPLRTTCLTLMLVAIKYGSGTSNIAMPAFPLLHTANSQRPAIWRDGNEANVTCSRGVLPDGYHRLQEVNILTGLCRPRFFGV
jgi:hypothetical protein